MNGRVKGLTNEIQGAFAMSHNPAPEMPQAGLARESEKRVAAQSPLRTLHSQKPSFPAAIHNFCFFPAQHGGGGVENLRMIEIDERPRLQHFRLRRGQLTCSLSLLACQGGTTTVAGIWFANETNIVRNAMPQFPIGLLPVKRRLTL